MPAKSPGNLADNDLPPYATSLGLRTDPLRIGLHTLHLTSKLSVGNLHGVSRSSLFRSSRTPNRGELCHRGTIRSEFLLATVLGLIGRKGNGGVRASVGLTLFLLGGTYFIT